MARRAYLRTVLGDGIQQADSAARRGSGSGSTLQRLSDTAACAWSWPMATTPANQTWSAAQSEGFSKFATTVDFQGLKRLVNSSEVVH